MTYRVFRKPGQNGPQDGRRPTPFGRRIAPPPAAKSRIRVMTIVTAAALALVVAVVAIEIAQIL